MCKLVIFVTLYLVVLAPLHGNANSECPLSGINSVVYFGFEQLSLMALQQGNTNMIEFPLLCKKGLDEECSKQQCCPEEIGCCYTNPEKHVRKCGCKKSEDTGCPYPAPYAILSNSECQDDQKTTAFACLREKRGIEGNQIVIFPRNLTVHPSGELKRYGRQYSDRNAYTVVTGVIKGTHLGDIIDDPTMKQPDKAMRISESDMHE